MVDFKLNDIGEGMHEGEIISWFVKEGDTVTKDQAILEVQTDKVSAELTSPVKGEINEIFYQEEVSVDVGNTLCTILEEGESGPSAETLPGIEDNNTSLAPVSVISDERPPLATPFVRQLAREQNIPLSQVGGTGPSHRITEEDLQRFVHKEVPAFEMSDSGSASAKEETKIVQEERIPLKGARKTIAEHMVKSVATIPQVTHVDKIEVEALKDLRDQLKSNAEQKNIKLTYLPFFVKSIVTALQEFKMLNASIDDANNEIVLKRFYHIGIATDTEDGLMVPVIRSADQKSIFKIAEEIRYLTEQARTGNLTMDQMTGSTFTISNVGPIGGMQATPIINHPEAAILALHKMEPRMVVRDWEGVIRLMTFDHRIIDGVMAVQFTNRIKEFLENPNLLFMEMD